MEKTIPQQIQQTINYHTDRLSRIFRLQAADRDDVRQELTLKALEAMRCHRREMLANVETYTKQAICRRAVDLMRGMIIQPVHDFMLFNCCLKAIGRSISFIIDVQSLIRTLTPRQKKICLMVMAGYTQEEIAKEFHISQQRVAQIINQIRLIFENL
jgi:DNA-directed RNA polymerase specialized sigma24 family protein